MGERTRKLVVLVAGVLLLTLAFPASAADRDKDGLRDGFEKRYGVTDPNLRDSDRDGVIDAAEDNDEDGLGNLGEQRFGTNPGRRDTDRDGVIDADEDHDRDGRSNAREQDQRRVPPNLRPTIADGRHSQPPIRAKCQTPHGRAVPVVCRFGPVGADVTVALLGDSHALMWSSPIRHIVHDKGWRLLSITKTACPALLGIYTKSQVEIDGGANCQRWRRNVIARLKADPPDLVIITQSDRYPLYTAKGALQPKSKRPALWGRALKKTLAALPARSRVLVMGDVPHNSSNPRRCLSHNRGDMSMCVSPRAGPEGRTIETALRATARASGAHFGTLSGKVCSYDPCPVVQGRILMWRDKGHLTNTFAVQLKPSIRALMVEALR
jgi:hypothetical protein